MTFLVTGLSILYCYTMRTSFDLIIGFSSMLQIKFKPCELHKTDNLSTMEAT